MILKNNLSWWGLLGFGGLAGLLLGSKPLLALLAFFLLFLTARVEPSEEFHRAVRRWVRNALIFGLASQGGIFLLAAVLRLNPDALALLSMEVMALMYLSALCWCYVLTVGVFVAGVLVNIALLGRKKRA